jgi:O-acetyl-ADP-ribose deacetylase (regulator of RNase III)
MRTVLVKHGSVTDGTEQLLVDASNTNVTLGSGVSGAIHAACGVDYQEHIYRELERVYAGPMQPGQVLITDAGTHPTARYVAHCAVMDYREGFTAQSYPTLELIDKCCENLWAAIETLDAPVSIAMVALGTGTGRLGLRDSTEVACCSLERHIASAKIGDVTFYGYELYEYVVILEVVLAHFDVPDQTIPDEVKQYLRASR